MRLEKEFEVAGPRSETARVLAEDETLLGLFPDSQTEIIERDGPRRTTRTRYRALGREGAATFHFTFLEDGDVQFEKVCDGHVWRELKGALELEEKGAATRVRLWMEGRTKAFVPEFTIRGPLQEQLDQMARALRRRIRSTASA